jgi:excisionase family DNA binding protein
LNAGERPLGSESGMATQPTSNPALESPGAKKKRERRVNPMDWRKRLYLSPTDIADALSIGRSSAYELIASGQLPSVRLGRSVRVETERVIEWAKSQLEGVSDHCAERGITKSKPPA